MNDTLETLESSAEVHLEYRTLSMTAVCAMVLAFFSLPAFLVQILLAIPLLGVIIGLIAILSIRKNTDQFSGLRMAKISFLFCLVVLVSGAGYHTYIYATEVPEGYERISFQQLQPDEKLPQLPVSPKSLELDGQKVFIKGFVHPSSGKENLEQFVLVPDMGTCCFGGQPKLTDMIQVTLRDSQKVNYSFYQRKLAGVLKVNKRKKPVSGLDGVYYELDASYVK